jgi:hypothetical protein
MPELEAKITISESELDKLFGVLNIKKKRSITMPGSIPVLREFGSGPVVPDAQLIAEITKYYKDSGLAHNVALQETLKYISELKKEGLRPMPFLRPSINKITTAYEGVVIGSDFDIEGMVVEIVKIAEAFFNQDSQKAGTPFKLKYEIE